MKPRGDWGGSNLRVFLRLRRSVVLPTKPPCYAGYGNGGSVLGCPLSLEVSKLYTCNTFNSSNKLRFDEKNCPDSYQINSLESRHRYPKFIFLFFFSVCLSFLSVLFGYGKPWRVNNGKVNTQVQGLTKLGRRLRSPDKSTATEKPCGKFAKIALIQLDR